jgi:F-type H+-transporting ATPase subunit b
MSALGINLGYFIFQVLNFSVLVILLYAWAYKPIINMLENRKRRIAQGFEDARVAAEARENAEKEAERITSEAQQKAGQIVREATDRAEAAGREVREAAQAEAGKEREIALAEVQQERERILSELRGQVAALAMAAAQKLIGESLDEKRQHTLIDEFFSGVKSGKVVVLEDAQVEGGSSAEVTSALALTEAEKETIRRDILSKAGNQATVTFRVDPAILGGLVVRVGDRVWDASVAGQLGHMRQNIV